MTGHEDPMNVTKTQADEILEKLTELKQRFEDQGKQLEQMRYSLAIPMQEEYHRKVSARQLSFMETLEAVSEQRLSLARFGDGELGLAAHAYRSIGFQRGSIALSRDLTSVLQDHTQGLLVAMPGYVIDPFWMTSFARYWGVLKNIIPENRTWGIANVSRANSFRAEGERFTQAWRNCWEGRNVTFITGKGSRFEPIDELFSNVKDMDFVHGPARNGYEQLAAIRNELATKPRDLAVIALGPAGTILASQLHKAGIQALDVGHINLSYHEAFNGGAKPEATPLVR